MLNPRVYGLDMQTKNYFDRLDQVRDEINRRLVDAKVELLNPDFFASSHRSFVSGVNYGETMREVATILTLRGRPTKKCAVAVIYRIESDTITHSNQYELTFYIS